MLVFLTGGSGFIGHWVVKQLLGRGHHLRLLIRNPTKIPSLRTMDGVTIVEGTLYDRDVMEKALTGCGACVHIALGGGRDAHCRAREGHGRHGVPPGSLREGRREEVPHHVLHGRGGRVPPSHAGGRRPEAGGPLRGHQGGLRSLPAGFCGQGEDEVQYRFGGDNTRGAAPKNPPFETIDPAQWPYRHERTTADEMYPALLARQILGEDMHIGGWTIDAFSRAVNWCGGVEPAMLAMMDDPSRFLALVDYLSQEASDWALDQILVGGMESICISCPFAGSSLISRKTYEQFVFEPMKRLAAAIEPTPAFSYIHTCGFIGDRLELLADSGVDGIECMDPPPLGDVELADAKRRIGSRVFLKGHLDSVNVLLRGSDEEVYRSVRSCLDAGMPGGGYILSTACSTANDVRPERMIRIRELVEKYGQHNDDSL
jgi:hypothetical protein